MITKRVKCISTIAYPGAPKDPELKLGKFYDVVDDHVITYHSPDPWISITNSHGFTIERPRIMFGPILTDKRRRK